MVVKEQEQDEVEKIELSLKKATWSVRVPLLALQ